MNKILLTCSQLTVRDAQRNARDTEILVSLVRSAAEMRTSFEEMKKFIAHQDGIIMEASDKQHERTYRALGGPRPLPPSNSRSRQLAAAPPADDEDMGSKRKNFFKRALKGMSLKSSNDLTRVEDMLEQLLDEVEALRDQQEDNRFGRSGTRSASIDQDGYEAEGEASTENQSGHISSPSRPVPGPRKDESRPSTVPEADEEDEYDARGEFLSPQLQSQESPKVQDMSMSGALDETTPPRSNDKARKHKSGPASFFPKFSRWSKTTGDNIRNSIQPKSKDRYSYDAAASRSGDLPSGPYDFDPQGEDRIRSRDTFDDEHQAQQEDRPPSPLIPSQVSEAPKYRAHRDSLNLQHPQPRQGPTGRYQTQLETQAQVYGFPSPQADQWGSTSSLSAANSPQKRNSAASRLSPISDAGYSEATSRHTGPPRPPKVRDDGPLVPERPPKVKDDQRSYTTERVVSRVCTTTHHFILRTLKTNKISQSFAIHASPRNSPPARKPTGPRPLNSGSQYSSHRRRGSPEQVDDLDY